jgi:hypothetical protein
VNPSLTGIAGGFLGFAPFSVQSWLTLVDGGESEYDAWVFALLYLFTGLYFAAIVVSVIPVWWRSLVLGPVALASFAVAWIGAVYEPLLLAVVGPATFLLGVATLTSASSLRSARSAPSFLSGSTSRCG